MRLLRSLTLASLALSATALADSSGRPHENCNNCHKGGQVPVVTVTPASTSVAPGSMLQLVVSISAVGSQNKGGFNLRASGGMLTPAGSGAKMIGSDVTHSAPKAAVSGAVTFEATWTAPSTPGTYTFSTWGNAVNGGQGDNGDKAAFAQATVTVAAGGDAGTVTDGGSDVDGGTDLDGGTVVDAGTDAGSDAGTDPDAGTDVDGGQGGGTLDGGELADGGSSGVEQDGGVTADGGTGAGGNDDPVGGCAAAGGGGAGMYGLLWLLAAARRRRNASRG